MRASPWSIGLVMIVLGAGSLSYAWMHGVTPTVTSAIAAAGLCLGGATLLGRRRIAFVIALGGTLPTIAFAAAGMAWHRELGLPLPSIVALVVGLYVVLRILIARHALTPHSLAEPRPPRE